MAEKIITKFNDAETKELVNMKAATIEELRERAEVLTKIVNSNIKDGNQNPVIEVFDADGVNVTAMSARDLIDATLTKHNSLTRTLCYTELKESGNPIVNACIQMQYPVIKCTEKKVGEKNRKTTELSVVDAMKNIDIKKLDEFCGGACVDGKWNEYVSEYNTCVMLKAGDILEIPPEKMAEYIDTYYARDIARKILAGETPTSNTQMLKSLQKVVTAMIGDTYKCANKQVKHSVLASTKMGKTPNSIKCASDGLMRTVLLGALHTIITGEDYELTLKTISK